MNKFKLKKSTPFINGWIHSPCTLSAEVLASSKFSSITIDLQHGMLDFNDCRHILQILSKYKIYPIVRVPSNKIDIINKCLDAGAKGIICPLINTKEDCEEFLQSCYYPPQGIRSYGPTLAALNNDKYFSSSKNEIMSIIMLETRESVINLNEILKLPLLDTIYVGPFDLSISYGKSPDVIFKSNKMKKIYQEVLTKVKKAQKLAAIHCTSAETAVTFLKMGFDFVTLSTDIGLLKSSLEREQEKVKKFIKNDMV